MDWTFLPGLTKTLRINYLITGFVFLTGYGASSGKPSEKNLYADIDGAWNALRTQYGVSPENILLYGQVCSIDNFCYPLMRERLKTDTIGFTFSDLLMIPYF